MKNQGMTEEAYTKKNHVRLQDTWMGQEIIRRNKEERRMENIKNYTIAIGGLFFVLLVFSLCVAIFW
jgi:hypothetical protein